MTLLVYMVDTLPVGLSALAMYRVFRQMPFEMYAEAGLVLIPLSASRN